MPLNRDFASTMECVYERDIDLLLVEELAVNPGFREWFVSQIMDAPPFAEFDKVEHSVIQGNRESDLIFTYRDATGASIAILVENKIDAAAQSDQALDYDMRGSRGLTKQKWQQYRTCLIAPRNYQSLDAHAYQHRIHYEDIAGYFEQHPTDPRMAYRAQMIYAAIEKLRRGYVAVISKELSDYATGYCTYAQTKFPHLHILPTGKRPADSTWIQFRPLGVPKSIKLYHQMTAGFVKAFWPGAAARLAEIEATFGPYCQPDWQIAPAGKSVSVNIEVPKLHPLRCSYESELPSIDAALIALTQLEAAFRHGQESGVNLNLTAAAAAAS